MYLPLFLCLYESFWKGFESDHNRLTLLVIKCVCLSGHREPAQSVCVADCYFIVNVLDLPFASPIAVCR